MREMSMITNNYGMGLERDIEQLTNLREIAKVLNYDVGIVEDLNRLIYEAQILLKRHSPND